MISILSVVLGFLLTGVVGNQLLQAWQRRSWHLQQRFLAREREYNLLKDLAEEISSSLGTRIFYMQQLNRIVLKGPNERVESRLQDYDVVLKRWNERLTSFYNRLSHAANEGLAIKLEKTIQTPLVAIGAELENFVRRRLNGDFVRQKEVNSIEIKLSRVQSSAHKFNKEMLNLVSETRTDIYYGATITFSSGTLKHFSTWQLIKALFIRHIDSHTVTRTPLDF